MTYNRAELEDALFTYNEAAHRSAATGDWNVWPDTAFTDDVHYYEHQFGHMHGKEAVRKWITEIMVSPGGGDFIYNPIRWYLIDEERGWIMVEFGNVLRDLGDGIEYDCPNWTKLEYAGDGRFSYQEDLYVPADIQRLIARWEEARQRLGVPSPAVPAAIPYDHPPHMAYVRGVVPPRENNVAYSR